MTSPLVDILPKPQSIGEHLYAAELLANEMEKICNNCDEIIDDLLLELGVDSLEEFC